MCSNDTRSHTLLYTGLKTHVPGNSIIEVVVVKTSTTYTKVIYTVALSADPGRYVARVADTSKERCKFMYRPVAETTERVTDLI